ncbi:MAG: hypothetical protein DHS20C15_06590 [Planctomycetota bacterium]|nr:MAG: hypothetical protein DHS20C15_06590 [Planctomycetota bacterium]
MLTQAIHELRFTVDQLPDHHVEAVAPQVDGRERIGVMRTHERWLRGTRDEQERRAATSNSDGRLREAVDTRKGRSMRRAGRNTKREMIGDLEPEPRLGTPRVALRDARPREEFTDCCTERSKRRPRSAGGSLRGRAWDRPKRSTPSA